MATWGIYYPDKVIYGLSPEGWRQAPDQEVQVVVLLDGVGNSTCREDGSLVEDRSLWTGESTYDPFGWGVKYGSTIPDADYWRIWEGACNGVHGS